MSIFSKIRRSPFTLAALGGAGQFAGAMVEDRRTRDTETRATRARLGEMTLRQMLEQQAAKGTETRQQASPLYKQQVATSAATQASEEAQLLGAQSKNAMTQAELDWVNAQPPETQALYWQRIRQTPGQIEAGLGATGALEDQRRAAANKPTGVKETAEQIRGIEDAWLVGKKSMEAGGDYQAAFNLGLEMGLSVKEAPRFATWVTQDFAKWKAAQLRPQKAGAGGGLALPAPAGSGAPPALGQPTAVPQAMIPAPQMAVSHLPTTGQQPLGAPVLAPSPFPTPGAAPPGAAVSPPMGPLMRQAVQQYMATRGGTEMDAYNALVAGGGDPTQ